VALLFGIQHAGTGVFFGHSLYDTGATVISSTSSGAAYAAVRLRIGTIWPLAFLHGLENFCNTRSPGRRPLVVVLDRGHLLRPLYGVAAPSVAPQLTSENPPTREARRTPLPRTPRVNKEPSRLMRRPQCITRSSSWEPDPPRRLTSTFLYAALG
jgi:hypothetical protein